MTLDSSGNSSKTKGIREKVFISSTCFDLKDLRAELAMALTDWGYLPIWNESPDFPKKHGLHAHDICLEAVKECDIYLLIIDKRYGGVYAGNKHPKEDISITWYETKIALQGKKEIYTFVRDEVWNERPTYKGNLKEGIQIKPHHVDNPKVFEFIDFIVHQPRDNWIDTFKDSVDLKEKLRVRLKDYKKRKTPLPPHFTNITPPEPNFVGRKEMLEAITEWYKNPDVHIGALIGWGGEGKSAIMRKWYDSLGKDDPSVSPLGKGGNEGGYPFGSSDIKPDGIFWWGFYRNPYLERFLDSLLDYLALGRIDLNEIKSTWAKVDKINELIQEAEYLIILDGLEEMQKGEERGEDFGCMVHREFTEILTSLADSKAKGLCLITTRYPLTDIKKWEGLSYQSEEVEPLSIGEGRVLFEKLGIKGIRDERNKVIEVIEDYKRHALSLTLLANYLVEDFEGDIKEAKEIPPFYSDKEAGGKAHRILLWYAQQLSKEQLAFMKIFSLFRRAVNERDFEGVFRSEMETSINKPLMDMSLFSFKRMVDNLYDRRLITKGQDDTYTTHPLIRNYFESIFEEEDKRLCHKRIYQYIGTYALEKPETLEEMQPLFEQVYHGCKAGLYDEVCNDVYREKICKWNEFFIIYKLGAWETNLLLVKTFFPKGDLLQMPLVSKMEDQSFLLNEAGVALICIGRPKEAEELIRRHNKIKGELEDWGNASTGYRNLAYLQGRSGELKKALENAEKAHDVAENTMSYWRIHSKAHLAWVLHLLGKNEEAKNYFRQADDIEIEISGNRLYGQIGVYYANFLLSINRIDEALKLSQVNLEICKSENTVNDLFLCHRCLGAIERIKKNHKGAEVHLREAVEISHKVGRPDFKIEVLLEFGRLYLDIKKYEDAIRDANEVMKICERTGFKLYEPDAEVVFAKVYLTQGDIDKAKQFAQSAYDKAKHMSYYWPQKDAEEILKDIQNLP